MSLKHIDDVLEQQMWALLDTTETTRASRFVHRADLRRFLAGRYLVRQLAAEQYDLSSADVVVRVDPRGKPMLPQLPLHISISHGGNWIVVASRRAGPVGVDVEAVPASCPDDLVPVALHQEEARWLARQPKEARSAFFFRLWTRKEAVLKVSGAGLSFDPRELRVLEDFIPATASMPSCEVVTPAVLLGHCLSLAWSRE